MKLATTIKGKLNKLNKNLKNNNDNNQDEPELTDERRNFSQTSHQTITMNRSTHHNNNISSNNINNNNNNNTKLPNYETHFPSPLQNMTIHRNDSKSRLSYSHDLTNDELDLNSNFSDDEYDEDDEDADEGTDDSFFNLVGNNPLRKVITYPESISHGVTFYKPLNKEQEEQINLDQMKLNQYKDLLDKASNAHTTILLELNLDGTIKYLSDHLFILHSKQHLAGQDISNFLAGSEQDKRVFHRTIELLLRDDESYKIKFTIPARKFDSSSGEDEGDSNNEDFLLEELPPAYYHLEAQGILIHDMFTNEPSFTMWIIKPIFDIDELDELPNQLVEKLGFGATIFNNRLASLSDIYDLNDVPPDKTEICRICETNVADWWLETHCSLCLYEHNLYDKIADGQENLKYIKQDLIELKKKLDSPNSSPIITAKNFEINAHDLKVPSLFSTLNLFITFCDDALNINNSELKMSLEACSLNDIEFQFSPNSQSNIQNVQDWKQRLISLVTQIEEGVTDSQDTLKDLLLNTIKIGDLKITRLIRLKHTQQYHLRLKTEIFILTNEVINQRIQSNSLNKNINESPKNASAALSILDSDVGETSLETPTSANNKQNINHDLLNEHFLTADNKIPILTVTKPTENTLTPQQSNKDVFVSANESEGDQFYENDDDPINGSDKLNSITFNNTSNELFSSSTNNSTPNRKRADSDLNGFSLSDSISPNTTGGNNIQNSEGTQKSINMPNISVATSILQRRSSASSVRHTNSNSNPKRSSPLVTHSKNNSNNNSNPPSMSIIQKNPTTKSVFVKSPLTSPFLNAVESSSFSSLANLNNNLFSLNSNGNSAPPQLSLHKTSIGSVIAPGVLSSGSGSKISTPAESGSKSFSSTVSASANSLHSKPRIVDYDIVKPISKGAFGSVFLAKRKITGDYVSIKCLKKSDMISKNQVTNVKTERAVMMAQTSKTYVAHLYATFQNKDHLFLVMEYLVGGDLRTLIKMIGPLPSKWIKQYTSEIIFGVADMHNDGIIHHDLKPDNLLLDRNGHVKFIDFGLSRIGLVNRQRKKDSHGNSNSNQTHSFSNSHSSNKHPSVSLHKSLYSSPPGSFSNLLGLSKANTDSSGRKNSDEYKSEANSSTGSGTPYSSMASFTNGSGFAEASFLNDEDSKLSFSLNKDSNGVNNFLKNINPNGTIPRTTTPPSMTGGNNNDSNTTNHSNLSSGSYSIKGHKSTVDPDTNYVIFDPDETNKNFKFMGTPDYIAPEVIKGESETPMCDWWSVGCIFFEFHFAVPPFHGDSPSEVFENILKCNIKWPSFDDEYEESLFITPEAKDLITKLLVLDPKKRLGYNSIDEIKNHPYFAGFDWTTVYQEEAEFVPSVTNPEDTDYFDNRGLSMNIDFQKDDSSSGSDLGNSFDNDDHAHKEQSEATDTNGPQPVTIQSLLKSSNLERTGSMQNASDCVSVSESVKSIKSKNSSLAAGVTGGSNKSSSKQDKTTDFGTFNFRNIHALDKANKEVINRLRNEHLKNINNESSTLASPSSNSIRHHSKHSSLSGLFGTNVSPHNSCLNLGLSDQSKKGLSTLGNSDFEDFEQPLSIPSMPMDSAENMKMVHNDSDNLEQFSPAMSTEVKFKLPDSKDFEKTQESMNLLIQEEERMDAVGKLQNVRKSRKMSAVSQSITAGGISRRASGSSASANNGYNNENPYEVALSSNSSIINSFSKNSMSFDLDVLVCESIPIHSYLMTKNLEQFGCRVVNVSNGDELVRRATSDVKFDLILTTFFSSKLNCFDIFKLIRNTNGANCNTPFIVITAYFQEALKMNVFDNVLEKPVSVSQMRSILSKYALKKAQENEDTLLSDAESDIFYDTKFD
ncbi:hypothetical protein ACO0SA_003690 [Hanseniaspora valbyensis]